MNTLKSERKRRLTKLRAKYLKGETTANEVDEYWTEILKDPEELELLKVEANMMDLSSKECTG